MSMSENTIGIVETERLSPDKGKIPTCSEICVCMRRQFDHNTMRHSIETCIQIHNMRSQIIGNLVLEREETRDSE